MPRAAVAASISAHVAWLDEQIETVMKTARDIVAADQALALNLDWRRTITGFLQDLRYYPARRIAQYR